MKLIGDTHTHTVLSGHAYSTITENMTQAAKMGLSFVAITDHGPAVPGVDNFIRFGCLRILPQYIDGVRLLKGIEVNIMDKDGRLDVNQEFLNGLDIVVASLHSVCIAPSSIEDNTKAAISAIKNPAVDIMGHLDRIAFEVNLEEVILAAKKYDKVIELNNYSYKVMPMGRENFHEIVRLCLLHNVMMTGGTDAHVCYAVGDFDIVTKIIDEYKIPENLVLNSSMENLDIFLSKRKARIVKCKQK